MSNLEYKQGEKGSQVNGAPDYIRYILNICKQPMNHSQCVDINWKK